MVRYSVEDQYRKTMIDSDLLESAAESLADRMIEDPDSYWQDGTIRTYAAEGTVCDFLQSHNDLLPDAMGDSYGPTVEAIVDHAIATVEEWHKLGLD